MSEKLLTGWLDEAEPPVDWRIEGLHEVSDNTTLAAAYKTGKTTTMTNLIRSMADGVPFLGELAAKPVEGRIYYWNLEVGEKRMRRWIRRLNIERTDRVVPDNLRGQRIELYDELFQEEVIEHLKRIECEVWIIDPMGRITSSWPGSHGRENNNDVMREVGEVLDRIKAEAGVQDLFVVTHTGRSGTHSRGATVVDDWPDQLWHMEKKGEDDEAIRYFWAEGRDVEFDKVPLDMDRETGSVFINRDLAGKKVDGQRKEVVKALLDGPLNATTLRDRIDNVDKNKRNEIRDEAVEAGWVNATPGKKPGSVIYSANEDHPVVQDVRMKVKGVEIHGKG